MTFPKTDNEDNRMIM